MHKQYKATNQNIHFLVNAAGGLNCLNWSIKIDDKDLKEIDYLSNSWPNLTVIVIFKHMLGIGYRVNLCLIGLSIFTTPASNNRTCETVNNRLSSYSILKDITHNWRINVSANLILHSDKRLASPLDFNKLCYGLPLINHRLVIKR